MKANAIPRLLSSLVWIDQYNECNGKTSFVEFMQSCNGNILSYAKFTRSQFHPCWLCLWPSVAKNKTVFPDTNWDAVVPVCFLSLIILHSLNLDSLALIEAVPGRQQERSEHKKEYLCVLLQAKDHGCGWHLVAGILWLHSKKKSASEHLFFGAPGCHK